MALAWTLFFGSSHLGFGAPMEELQKPALVLSALDVLKVRVIPKAVEHPKLAALLDKLHVGKTSYRRALERIVALDESDRVIKLSASQNPDSGCRQHVEGGTDVTVQAFTFMGSGRVTLCDSAFRLSPSEKAGGLSQEERLARILLHEFFHVQGIEDECTVEALTHYSFVFAGYAKTRPTYLWRCKPLERMLKTF